MSSFIDKLERACESRKSLLCVGLDPDPQRMAIPDVFEFNRAVIDSTADLVCAYKPNTAFYEALGIEGLKALGDTITHIRKVSQAVVIIGDCKRGDIGSSMAAYHKAMFDVWGFDAITVSPYLGGESVLPLEDYRDKGVFVLCRTSNPSAVDFQDVIVASDGEERPVYQLVAKKCQEWNRAGNLGLVVGATYPEELKLVRELCPGMPILIPGVGAQGGDLAKAVLGGTDSRGRLALINSSRQVLYASKGVDFSSASRKEALKLRAEINDVLVLEGKGWS